MTARYNLTKITTSVAVLVGTLAILMIPVSDDAETFTNSSEAYDGGEAITGDHG